MEALSDLGNFILTPLYYVISAIMIGFHDLFSLFLSDTGGLGWALSIVGLTVVIRIALIPLFVRQIKSSRNMQLIQPKVVELRKKYGHDRQRMAEETMKLYKDAGTNPFASCLPLLLQMPIFFALFRLLDQAADGTPHGFMNAERAQAFGTSDIFGFVPISDTFWESRTWGPAPDLSVMLVALVLVLAMTATTFITQRQLMSKNMPADALKGQYAQQQKLLLYVLPVAFGLGGVAFPIGVLLYWTTSNLWTMGQQFYVIRNNPAPGTPAMDAKLERDKAKAIRKGEYVEPEPAAAPVGEARPATRQQPKRQTRQQRQQGAPRATGGGSTKAGGHRPAGGSTKAGGQRPGSRPKPANKKGKK